ncbi:MAG TPA: TIR domain-containing protein [Beijerinckiaceae bacterium]|jgi:WD40 repeat protein
MAAVFISHSSKDRQVTAAVEAWLTTNGFDDFFIDYSKIRGGDKWSEALREEAGSCRVVLCLVTRNWLSSDECYGEFMAAFYQGKRIIPLIALDPAPRTDLEQKRLTRVLAEDQGVQLSIAALSQSDDLEVALGTQNSETLKAGLRAGGALVKVGLDPRAFEVDRDVRPSPFPGLESFGDQDADAAIFFGRSPEIARCLEDLREMRAQGVRQPYAILGASGSGKSSLMKAGVLPRLRREQGWLILRTFRPGADPLMNFATAIADTLAELGEQRAPGAIRDELREVWRNLKGSRFVAPDKLHNLREQLEVYFSRLRDRFARPSATILVPLDQAEELVSPEGESADALSDYLRASLLPAPANKDGGPRASQTLLVLTIRTDSFPQLQKSDRFADLDARCTDIRPLPLYRFGSAIEGPAERYGVHIEPGLVEAMIEDAPGEDALPLLAFALQRLWRQYHAEKRLRRADYEGIGKISALIDDAAERALQGIRPEDDEPLKPTVPNTTEQLAAKTFVPTLAQINQSGGTIRRIANLTHFQPEEMRLLELFTKWRLVVAKHTSERAIGTVEVTHEAIFRSWLRLQRWIDRERGRMQHLRDLESAAQLWTNRDRAPVYLAHRGSRLSEAQALLEVPDFAKEIASVQREYLRACSAAQVRRRAAAGGGIFGLFVLVFVIQGIMEAASLRADMRLAADALIKEGHPAQAAQFAIAGTFGKTDVTRFFSSFDAEAALRSTGFTLKVAMDLRTSFIAEKARLTRDGARLLIVSADQNGALWDVATKSKIADLGNYGSVKAFLFTDDETRLVTQSADNAFKVWDARTGALLGGSGAATYARAGLTSSPPRLVTVSESGTATLWDLHSASRIGTLGEENEVEAWALLSEPPRVLTRSRQKGAQLWNSLTGEHIATLGGAGVCEVCTFSAATGRAVSFDASGRGRVFDASTGIEIPNVVLDAGARLAGLTSDRGGNRLISRSIYNKLTLWDPATGAKKKDLGSSDSENYAFSPEGESIVIRANDGSGQLLSMDGVLLHAFAPGQMQLYKFAPAGKRLLTTDTNRVSALWNTATGAAVIASIEPGPGDHAVFSPSGNQISVGASETVGALWDAERGVKLSDYDQLGEEVGGSVFSRDGRRLVTSGAGNFGNLRDGNTGKHLAVLGGAGAVYSASLSADGRRVVTLSVHDLPVVWETETLPNSLGSPQIRSYVCAINYNAVRVFAREARTGSAPLEGVGFAVAHHLKGRPWHPCDWRGLLSIEGWKQLLRLWGVRFGLVSDYGCSELRAVARRQGSSHLCDEPEE